MTTAASQIYVLFPNSSIEKFIRLVSHIFRSFLNSRIVANVGRKRNRRLHYSQDLPKLAPSLNQQTFVSFLVIFGKHDFPDFSTNLNKIRGKLYIERKVKNNLVVNLIVSINYKNKNISFEVDFKMFTDFLFFQSFPSKCIFPIVKGI